METELSVSVVPVGQRMVVTCGKNLFGKLGVANGGSKSNCQKLQEFSPRLGRSQAMAYP